MPTMGYGDGTLRQRQTGIHAGRWEYRRSVDGRRRTATWDRKPTRAQITAKIAEWSSTSASQKDGYTVGEYAARWLRDGLSEARGRTIQRYRVIFEKHILPEFGEVPLSAVSTPDIQRWVNELPAVKRHALMCFRASLSQAVRWGFLDRNPAQYVRSPKVERKEPRRLSAEQTRTLLEQVRGDPLEALWLVAVYTGMRQGEILGLRWQDVSLPKASLTVNTSLWWKPGKGGRVPVLTMPKTERSRRPIELHRVVVEALREHQKREMLTSKDGLVFHRNGIALEPSAVYRALQRHLKAAGLPHVTFHQLRHGTASLLLESGMDVAAVSDLLGHATPYVTMSIYAHSIEKRRSEVAQRMGDLLEKVSEVVSG